MRVAFVNQTGEKPGGAEESLALLLKHLPQDIEPCVILFTEGEFADRLRGLGLPPIIVSVAAGLRSITRDSPASRALTALPGAVARLAQTIARAKVDVVHTNSMKAHLLAAPAARLRGLRTVMHLRDMVGGSGRVALRGVAFGCTRERIAISSAVSRWYTMPNTRVVANPVELSEYDRLPQRADARVALGLPLDGLPVIGIVGRINRWKGHDRFLKIAARVNERQPIRCVIVGEPRFRDDDFVPELHRLAAQLGISERTTFVPWLADPRTAYAALDVHCNCSEREPFGRSIVEAAAAGVPTVAFNDGGAVDIVTDGIDGRLIAAGDDEAFAQAVFELVHDEERRTAVGAAARARSRRFSAEAHARSVAEILRRNARAPRLRGTDR